MTAPWLNSAMPEDRPIILSTFGSLVQHGYCMDVTCWRCERSVRIDLDTLPPEVSYIGRRFRCSCGERCMPSISGSSARHREPPRRTEQ